MRTREDFARWRGMTAVVYSGLHHLFVPPVRQQLARLFAASRKPDARIAFVGVEDQYDRLRARAALHHDDALDAKLGERVQLFGFTEFVDDPAVSACLFEGLRAAALRAGRTLLLGPAKLLPSAYGGVVTSGFESRGFADSAYNPPHYAEHYRQAGFTERHSSATWICDTLDRAPDPGQVFGFDDSRLNAERLALRYGATRRPARQAEIWRALLNDCLADRPDCTPISAEDMKQRMDGLSHIRDQRLLMRLTREDEPIGFALCLPDISRFLMKTRGDLGLINRVRLISSPSSYRGEAVLVAAGVARAHRGKGYMTLMTRELFRNLIAGGYREVRGARIEDDNPGAAAQFLKMGARVLHELAWFERKAA